MNQLSRDDLNIIVQYVKKNINLGYSPTPQEKTALDKFKRINGSNYTAELNNIRRKYLKMKGSAEVINSTFSAISECDKLTSLKKQQQTLEQSCQNETDDKTREALKLEFQKNKEKEQLEEIQEQENARAAEAVILQTKRKEEQQEIQAQTTAQVEDLQDNLEEAKIINKLNEQVAEEKATEQAEQVVQQAEEAVAEEALQAAVQEKVQQEAVVDQVDQAAQEVVETSKDTDKPVVVTITKQEKTSKPVDVQVVKEEPVVTTVETTKTIIEPVTEDQIKKNNVAKALGLPTGDVSADDLSDISDCEKCDDSLNSFCNTKAKSTEPNLLTEISELSEKCTDCKTGGNKKVQDIFTYSTYSTSNPSISMSTRYDTIDSEIFMT
jgi:hypothetical protein